MGDRYGNYQNIEFGGSKVYFLDNKNNHFIHTNHYLMNEHLNSKPESLKSSFNRYKIAINLATNTQTYSLERMKKILLDDTDPELPICRKFIPGDLMEEVGTVCTILMDLNQEMMHITKGSPLHTPFTKISLN
jgi:hypothetical protein